VYRRVRRCCSRPTAIVTYYYCGALSSVGRGDPFFGGRQFVFRSPTYTTAGGDNVEAHSRPKPGRLLYMSVLARLRVNRRFEYFDVFGEQYLLLYYNHHCDYYHACTSVRRSRQIPFTPHNRRVYCRAYFTCETKRRMNLRRNTCTGG